jgi:hypothetical protein
MNKILQRHVFNNKEKPLTLIQILGLCLILLGVGYFATFLVPTSITDLIPWLKLDDKPESSEVAIAFFTTMLGVAFAFPDMLKGQTKEISTMRIIVFMLANVITMLLIKMGWDKDSLTGVGLDGYWMGVIAFLFGAKATQTYFEKFQTTTASPVTKSTDTTVISSGAPLFSPSVLAQLAKVQNENDLFLKYPTLESVSDIVQNDDAYLRLAFGANPPSEVPKSVDVLLNDKSKIQVKTDIVSGVGDGTPHFKQLTNTIYSQFSPDIIGSICCKVQSADSPERYAVLTSGHVFTYGKFIPHTGIVNPIDSATALSNGEICGNILILELSYVQDLALIGLNPSSNLNNNLLNFPVGFYSVSESDKEMKTPEFTILSAGNKKRTAYLLDFNVSVRVQYADESKQIMRNVLLVGSNPNPSESRSVSVPGDSGSCVYHTQTGKLLGMVLGANLAYTYVLPIETTLNKYNYKLV